MTENALPMKTTTTGRGFALIEFTDYYDEKCTLQKSSLATEDAIWLGIDDPKPQVMASQAGQVGVKTNETCGWVPYPIPKGVSISTRMHLTRAQVKELLPVLRHFVKTGELP
jgi:hypothetical protein